MNKLPSTDELKRIKFIGIFARPFLFLMLLVSLAACSDEPSNGEILSELQKHISAAGGAAKIWSGIDFDSHPAKVVKLSPCSKRESQDAQGQLVTLMHCEIEVTIGPRQSVNVYSRRWDAFFVRRNGEWKIVQRPSS